MDCVVSDFIAGAAEMLSPDAGDDHLDVIEGQGSLFHPSYAGVSLGLLARQPARRFVVCHEPGRDAPAGPWRVRAALDRGGDRPDDRARPRDQSGHPLRRRQPQHVASSPRRKRERNGEGRETARPCRSPIRCAAAQPSSACSMPACRERRRPSATAERVSALPAAGPGVQGRGDRRRLCHRSRARRILPARGPWGGLAAMLARHGDLVSRVRGDLPVRARRRERDYRSFFHALLGRAWPIFEIAYILFVILILAVFGAAAGAIASRRWASSDRRHALPDGGDRMRVTASATRPSSACSPGSRFCSTASTPCSSCSRLSAFGEPDLDSLRLGSGWNAGWLRAD